MTIRFCYLFILANSMLKLYNSSSFEASVASMFGVLRTTSLGTIFREPCLLERLQGIRTDEV